MGVEEFGGRNPVEHFLGRGESPFVSVAIETKELEGFDLRGCQADIRRIRDVSIVVKELVSDPVSVRTTIPVQQHTFNPATVHVSPMVLANIPRIIPNSP